MVVSKPSEVGLDTSKHGVTLTHGGKRVFIEDVITEEVAKSLRSKTGRLRWDDWRLEEPLAWMRSFFPIKIGESAYVVVERRNAGHKWHVDTGDAGHMPWCRYTAGVGLSPADMFSGGGFYFRDSGPLYHYRDMIAYTADQEHMVESHTGERFVLLMFFEGEDG
jgi:hypothetical protein